MRPQIALLVLLLALLSAWLFAASMQAGNAGMVVAFFLNWLSCLLWLIWARWRMRAGG